VRWPTLAHQSRVSALARRSIQRAHPAPCDLDIRALQRLPDQRRLPVGARRWLPGMLAGVRDAACRSPGATVTGAPATRRGGGAPSEVKSVFCCAKPLGFGAGAGRVMGQSLSDFG
jgi:hypothetical protein